jgi:hypothetical protein
MRIDNDSSAKRLGKAAALANATLMVAAFLFSLLLAHLLLVYNFNSPPSVPHYYYLIPILGVSLSLLALRLPPNIRVKLTLVLTSTVLAHYVAEGAFYLLAPDPIRIHRKRTAENAETARRQGNQFDLRSGFDVVEDLRSHGVDAYPAVFSAVQLKDESVVSLNGVSGKTTVMCNESGAYVTYQSDEHGFNNPPGTWSKRPDMVLLGDSFAHGYCVPPPEDIAGQLRQAGIGALNLGVGGNGPLREFALFKEFAEPLKPKVILWAYFEGNDLEDLNFEKTWPTLLRYDLDDNFSQNLMHRQAKIDSLLADYVKDRMQDERLRLGRVPGALGFYHRLALSEFGKGLRLWHLREAFDLWRNTRPPDFDSFGRILRKVQNISSQWGGRVYFVYLPAYERYGSNVDEDAYLHRRQVLSLVESLNIPIIDLHPAFLGTGDPLSLFPFRKPNHYSAEGHRLAAFTIETQLLRDGVVTPASDAVRSTVSSDVKGLRGATQLAQMSLRNQTFVTGARKQK